MSNTKESRWIFVGNAKSLAVVTVAPVLSGDGDGLSDGDGDGDGPLGLVV
jgi:hypothetical protein